MKKKKLKNRYFALRHGESEANVENLVSCRPGSALRKCGLTEKGRGQVGRSVKKYFSKGLLSSNTVIVSSDYLRARETAKIAKNVLGVMGQVELRRELRERDFGKFDGLTDGNKHFRSAWMKDEADPDNREDGVESPREVVERTSGLIMELEGRCRGGTILLVSHCDPIQLLHTWFLGVSPAGHRELPGFPSIKNGEIRELK